DLEEDVVQHRRAADVAVLLGAGEAAQVLGEAGVERAGARVVARPAGAQDQHERRPFHRVLRASMMASSSSGDRPPDGTSALAAQAPVVGSRASMPTMPSASTRNETSTRTEPAGPRG